MWDGALLSHESSQLTCEKLVEGGKHVLQHVVLVDTGEQFLHQFNMRSASLSSQGTARFKRLAEQFQSSLEVQDMRDLTLLYFYFPACGTIDKRQVRGEMTHWHLCVAWACKTLNEVRPMSHTS